MYRKPVPAFALALALLLTAPAFAASDPVCQDGENLNACLNRLLSASIGPLAKASSDEKTDDRVKNKLAPDDATDDAASLRSFLPKLLTAVGFQNVKDENGVLSFQYTTDANGPGKLTFRGTLNKPAVFESLAEAIPEGVRTARKEALEKQLDDFDDFQVEVTLSLLSGKLGVDFAAHQDLFTQSFTNAHAGAMGNAAVVQLLQNIAASPNPGVLTARFSTLDAASRAQLEQDLQAAVTAVSASHQALEKYVAANFLPMADLVKNQPQLYFTAKLRSREEIAGPDSWSASATWEKGLTNVNSFTAFCDDAGRPADPGCLDAYLTADRKAKAKAGNRFKLTVAYSETDAYAFPLPDSEETFTLDKAESLTASLTYGRYLRTDASGKAESHFDLESKYEDVSGDDTKNNRWVTTATVTQKLTDNVSLAAGVVYANRPEYRGEVTKELSAKWGLKLKLDKKKK